MGEFDTEEYPNEKTKNLEDEEHITSRNIYKASPREVKAASLFHRSENTTQSEFEEFGEILMKGDTELTLEYVEKTLDNRIEEDWDGYWENDPLRVILNYYSDLVGAKKILEEEVEEKKDPGPIPRVKSDVEELIQRGAVGLTGFYSGAAIGYHGSETFTDLPSNWMEPLQQVVTSYPNITAATGAIAGAYVVDKFHRIAREKYREKKAFTNLDYRKEN